MIEDTESLVCVDIRYRQQLGIRKYGTTLADNPLTEDQWIEHAYHEALDLALYLRRLMQQRATSRQRQPDTGSKSH